MYSRGFVPLPETEALAPSLHTQREQSRQEFEAWQFKRSSCLHISIAVSASASFFFLAALRGGNNEDRFNTLTTAVLLLVVALVRLVAERSSNLIQAQRWCTAFFVLGVGASFAVDALLLVGTLWGSIIARTKGLELYLSYVCVINGAAVLATTYGMRRHLFAILIALYAACCWLSIEVVARDFSDLAASRLMLQLMAVVDGISAVLIYLYLDATNESLYKEHATRVSNLEAGRRADSRLNHIIKGKCGGARMSLLCFEQALHEASPPLLARPLPADVAQLLQQPSHELERAISWCHRRQMFVTVEEGV